MSFSLLPTTRMCIALTRCLFCLLIVIHAKAQEAKQWLGHTGEQIEEQEEINLYNKLSGNVRLGQQAPEIRSSYKGIDATTSLPKRTLNINPLGLLQFGPILQGEFRVTESGYVVSHVRIPYLGLLYHLIVADGEEVTVSPVALGLGAGYKNFFLTQNGAWYLGGMVDYSFGSSKGNNGNNRGNWESEFSNIAIMPNAGYRWRWPEKGKSISVGMYAGIYTALRDEWWYTGSPEGTYDERSTSALVMVELSFGWEK